MTNSSIRPHLSYKLWLGSLVLTKVPLQELCNPGRRMQHPSVQEQGQQLSEGRPLKADVTVELIWKWPENSSVAPLNHLPESLSPRDPKGVTTHPNKINKMKIYPTEQEKIFVEHIPDKE